MASRVDERRRSRSAVNSVFTQRTDDEFSQYDSSEYSDEEGQMPNNIKESDSFIISFTDDCIDTVTVRGGTAVSADSDSAVVSSSTSKSTGISLQEAFKRFKKKKQKQIRRTRKKQKNGTKEARLRSMANPDRMQRLRMKFLDEAKRYMGVPYAKKYWKPEDPEYKSKLFLDCCGLVRRVMLNLKSDFGFRIGPWNQAYMCDTLPITVKREEDMKPGDLVFISATYYNPKMKKQKHSMTHVEIWLGDGVKTIGARWNKGKVQVFDSYRFKAMSYHSETYIFKSIDTWLKGQCRSHCPYHAWKKRSKKFKPSKNSVFRESGQSESDKSAGDADSQQYSASTLDSDTTTEAEQSSVADVEEKAEDEMPELRQKETRPSFLRSMSGSTSDESSLCSSVSGESVEDVMETARRRLARKTVEDQMSGLTIEEGTTDGSSVCSSVSIESAEDVIGPAPTPRKVPPLRSVLKISKIGAWETGKNARNEKQRNKESADSSIKKSLSSASRESMQRHIERGKRGVGNLAPIRNRGTPRNVGNRNSVGNSVQGLVQSRKGWAEKVKGDVTEKPTEVSSEAPPSSRKTKDPTIGSGDKSRVRSSKSENNVQSSKTHSAVSRRPSF